ncbi:MAG: universal stress protein, partial [Vicinamibacteria bacterium]
GSMGAQNARDFLDRLAFAPGTELLVVSVVPDSQSEDETSPADEVGDQRSWADLAAYRLARAGLSTDSLLVRGHAAEQICRLAEERAVDLVVVGSRGRSSLSRFILGSVSGQVVKHAATSVLIVKKAVRPIEKVMIGVDGSEDSNRAVAFLGSFPLPLETSVDAVHVIQVRPFFCSTAEGYSETSEIGKAYGESSGRRRAGREGSPQESLGGPRAILPGRGFHHRRRAGDHTCGPSGTAKLR